MRLLGEILLVIVAALALLVVLGHQVGPVEITVLSVLVAGVVVRVEPHHRGRSHGTP